MFCAIKRQQKGLGSDSRPLLLSRQSIEWLLADAGLRGVSRVFAILGEGLRSCRPRHPGCGQSFGIAFDGKARTIVILADMHGNELFGAIGNKFARGFGGLAIERCPLSDRMRSLKKAGIFSLAQHGHIVVAFECEDSTIFEGVHGLAR